MTFDLAAAAGEFGDELQQLLDAVLPYEEGADPELRQVTVTASRLAFAVELGTAKAKQAKAIPLLYQGRKVAELFILVRLVADSAERYPAVAKSKFELRMNRHPLLRLDFDREMHTAPGSHWNVHAERGAITGLLARNNPDHSGELSKLHLSVAPGCGPAWRIYCSCSSKSSGSTRCRAPLRPSRTAASGGAAGNLRRWSATTPRKRYGSWPTSLATR